VLLCCFAAFHCLDVHLNAWEWERHMSVLFQNGTSCEIPFFKCRPKNFLENRTCPFTNQLAIGRRLFTNCTRSHVTDLNSLQNYSCILVDSLKIPVLTRNRKICRSHTYLWKYFYFRQF
jgi:hypothetical protein